MGKSKGGKYFKPPRSRKPGGRPGEEDEEGSEEEFTTAQRGLGGQASTVGMLPPSDSEEDEGEEGAEKKEKAPKPAKNSTAGLLPPNSSDEEDEDESEDESSDDQPINEYLSAPSQKKKGPQPVERDEETIRKDLERLELIRKKREDDRAKRIADEGWDRFAPISDTNRPPGYVPADHPSNQK